MKKNEIRYYVIGGQYAYYNHGGAATIAGAKILATKNEEYWDNWQGWHKPSIYKAEDCEVWTNFFGTDYYPKTDADPYMVWDEQAGKWRMYERIHP